MKYLAQRGTKVALIDADSLRHAGPPAARALGLPMVRPRPDPNCKWETTAARRYARQAAWLDDWRGRRATLRRANDAEVAAFIAAVDQQDEVRSLTKAALRDRVRGHEQAVLA